MAWKIGSGFLVFLLLTAIGHAGPPPATQPQQDDKPPQEKSAPVKPATTLKVSGRIVDRDGKGVASSQMTITGPKGSIKTTTDSTGAFAFEGVPGKYAITVRSGSKSKSFQQEIGTDKPGPLTLIFE
jgi:Carboxypeptidase regulatory-like domain